MQSYPDPNVGPADAGAPYYGSASSQPPPSLSNADDIQLTAQLTRGLAPLMNAGPGGNMSDSQDPRAHGGVNIPYEQDPALSAHGQHMQGRHESIDQLGIHYQTPDGSTAPRKRSKASRACDECRRKKIKCDATGEPGDETCSSCKRIGSRCQFSRVPMKRGPSKGYIKELADRLNHLEGAMQVQTGDMPIQQHHLPYDSPLQRRPSEEFSPPPNADSPQRKRKYSSVSGDFASPYQPRVPNSWPSQDNQRQLPQIFSSQGMPQSSPNNSQIFRESEYTPNGMQPIPHWRNAPPPARHHSSSFEGLEQGEHIHPDQFIEADDGVIDGYYNTIHPTFPMLSQNRQLLGSRLSKCPVPLVEAFHDSLRAAVQSFTQPSLSPNEQQPGRRAANFILGSQLEDSSTRSMSANLVHLQVMLLLAIEAGNYPPSILRGHSKGSNTVWLSMAVALSFSMKLHLVRHYEPGVENDIDTDEKLARRIWLSLMMMDRWHASSTASPSSIPDSSVVLYEEDKALLGESVYQLARLSIVVGHLSEINTGSSASTNHSISPIVGTLVRGEIDRWLEGLPASMAHPADAPLVHLCYWHLRILVDVCLSDSEPSVLLNSANKIITQSPSKIGVVSPLAFQPIALATLALLQLTSDGSTKEDAEKRLSSISESQITPTAWDIAIKTLITSKQQKSQHSSSSQAAENQHAVTAATQGLRHLADLATATEESRETAGGESIKKSEKSSTKTSTGSNYFTRYHELREQVKVGFLSAFSGDSAR